MANSILNSHYPNSSNTILTSHGWPDNTSGNALLVSHGDPYTAGGGGGSGGTLTHGSEFTITTASGFGTRAAKPLVYDNFESGTPGNAIAGQAPLYRGIGGSWTWDEYSSNNAYHPVYSNAIARGAFAQTSMHQFGWNGGLEGYNTSLVIDYPCTNTGDEVYCSWWARIDRTSAYWPTQWKPFDEFGSNGGGVTPSVYAGYGPELRSALQDSGLSAPTIWGTSDYTTMEDEWVRFEGYFKQSAASTDNGVYSFTVHRTGTPSIENELLDETIATRATSDYWTQWMFGCFYQIGGTGATANIHLSSLYFDSTRRRLELGNASTYAACTRREVQPSTAWSDTSITALCQKGAIPTGTAYLFVIGADGTASAGIEVDVA